MDNRTNISRDKCTDNYNFQSHAYSLLEYVMNVRHNFMKLEYEIKSIRSKTVR